MGPRARYLGPEVPAEELLWQDPVPPVKHQLVDAQDIEAYMDVKRPLRFKSPRSGTAEGG